MNASLNRRIVTLAALAFVGCVVLSVRAAAQDGEISLPEVVRRLVGLENRVAKLEKQMGDLRRSAAASQPGLKLPDIEITSPADDADVGSEPVVEGLVHADLGEREPVILVHPLQTNLFWVQQIPPSLDRTAEGLRFRSRVFLGSKDKGLGEQFELYAVLARKDAHHEGDLLDKLPSDAPVSKAILVTRAKD